MGDVAVTLKVMPDSPEIDLEKLREEISKKVKIQDYNTEEIAFGLKALRILIVKPDTGGTDDIEKQIKEIEGVSDVEVESVTLV
jgi:elongation factor 1-beta